PAASGTTAAATESNFKAAFLWNMADYLVGAGSSVELGTGSSISFNFPAYSAAGGLSLANEKRMIVNQGGTYYISQQWTAGASNSTGWDPSATDWAVLNTSDYSYGAFNNLLLDDVRGVGFYAQGAAVGGSGFKIGSFEVTAVPEPSTYALIAGFLALGLILVRRRRNN
ncbi:MAG TPA: PEP-CTERM sorting domain-containing protein, partial [Oceanipulchritudo sp.]|nr:PEP-CTERM sorting domain-containing protein [Oceanipulchritudo sp.]